MTVEQKFETGSDKFPVGMRVLAVDDDPACLKLLEALLRKCQYHVTTTNQAALALQMLRENKDNFDLVISDVCMPDMDGFKLLELMGIDLDLPVIMLSAYGDTDTVTKGIRYGACDYLLKPVRYEALKLIWQHVVRRKIDKKRHGETDEVGDGFTDQNSKFMRKRKDQSEKDENNEDEEDKDKNSDPSTQKKPRIVWTGELHRKFVAAVNYLGVDKAVPKTILQMMNEEKLTRENVASHLQKYRQYLNKISCEAKEQANMATAPWGRSNSAFWRTGTMNLPTFVGFDNASSRPFPRNTALGRLNNPTGMGILGTSSSGIIQGSDGQKSTGPINHGTNFHSFLLSENHNENMLQGVPLPLDPNPSQYTQNVTDESMFYPSSSVFLGGRTDVSSSSYSLSDTYNNLLMNQSSVLSKPLNSEFPSHLLDYERCYDNWPTAVQSSSIQSSCYVLNDCFNPQVEDKGKDFHRQVSPISSNGGEQSSSVNPFPVQSNEDNMVQIMSFDSNPQNCVGSLEDIVTAMMKEEKGKMILNEAHRGCEPYSHSISNCIYT